MLVLLICAVLFCAWFEKVYCHLRQNAQARAFFLLSFLVSKKGGVCRSERADWVKENMCPYFACVLIYL